MTYVLTANNRASRDAHTPSPKLHEDGTPYKWRMFFDNNEQIVDADTLAECLHQIIPGYLDMDEEKSEHFLARVGLAERVAAQGRAVALARTSLEKLDELEDWERNILEGGDDDTEFFHPGWNEDSPAQLVWYPKIPLFLVETGYSPFVENWLPPISGISGDVKYPANILWLRPSDEEQFLRDLHLTGYIAFGVPNQVDARDAEVRAAATEQFEKDWEETFSEED